MDSGDFSPIEVASLRELEALVASISAELGADDWDIRFAALKTLRGVVVGNAPSFAEFSALLRSDIFVRLTLSIFFEFRLSRVTGKVFFRLHFEPLISILFFPSCLFLFYF
jgi:hypothetical protein